MAETKATVQVDTLIWHVGDECHFIPVGSAEWYTWLSRATRFSFSSDQGTFTAYLECRERGGSYWKAYRRRSRKLHRVYLGKSELISLERLNAIAATLAGDEQAASLAGANARCVDAQLTQRDPASTVAATTGPKLPASSSSVHTEALLRTKLSPPLAHSDLVLRPRLIERLCGAKRHKLTLLSAPAGFGKTTLLSQWLLDSGHPVAWLSLDAGDNDPARFWAYVVAALQTQCPHLGEAALTLLRSPQAPSIESVLSALANEIALVPDDLTLVLDDYHIVEDQAIHRGMEFFLEHLPPRLKLVIATRGDPSLPLARLRGRGELNELRAADLSFTSAESTSFFNDMMQLGLTPENIAALQQRTEGWAVGLQLAGLSMRGREDTQHSFIKAFTGDHRYVMDYLIEEVLHRQPTSVQSFLLQTCILDRLSGPLCEAVAGLDEGEGQAMLEVLENANLFTVPLDNERRWYRYHRLFADCLQVHSYRSHAGQVSELHRRACTWYASHGLPTEAVRHALAVGEFELAAGLIEQTGEGMLLRSEVKTVLGWMRMLPDDLVRNRPYLCVLHASSLLGPGLLDAAEARLQDAERCLGLSEDGEPYGETAGVHNTEIQHMKGKVLACRATIAAGRRDLSRTISLSNQALEKSSVRGGSWGARILLNLGLAYLWSGDVVRAGEALAEAKAIGPTRGDYLSAMLATGQLASVQAIEGHLHPAAKTYRQALQLAAEPGTPLPPAAARLHLGLALLLYEWNDLDVSRRYTMEGLELADGGVMTDLVLLGQGVLARLKQAEGDIDGALDIMDRAEQLAWSKSLTQELRHVAKYRVRLWLKRGNVKAALGWAQASGLREDDSPSYFREAEHLTLARVLIAGNQSDEAVLLLGRLLSAAESAGRTGSMIKILVLDALAQQALKNTEEALRAVARALSMAAAESYGRTFIDEGLPMAVLLSMLLEVPRGRICRAHDVPLGYARSLLTAFDSAAVPWQRHKVGRGGLVEPAGDPLTERELEVLRLVAAGYSPPAIAQELIVSVNTVKTHVKSIYGKLQAHSGTMAVSKARELRLL